VTHEDICSAFSGDTLLAVVAPAGTQLEVPLPEMVVCFTDLDMHNFLLLCSDGNNYQEAKLLLYLYQFLVLCFRLDS